MEGTQGTTTPDLLDGILGSLQDGVLLRAGVGRRWTAAVVEVEGETRCGLAATWDWDGDTAPARITLAGAPAMDLASTLQHAVGIQASLAAATLNALLPRHPERWTEMKVEDVIRQRGSGRAVAMVGHFPFVDAVRPDVGRLTVLERNPRPGDLHEEAAAEVLPGAEVVVITGLAFVNRSLTRLLRLCSPHAHVILAGPSAPLSPLLFARGIHQVCGAVVTNVEAVVRAVQEGDGFHGVHRAGVRLVTMTADGLA